MIKILQIKFASFKKQHELIVTALIECVVDVIKNSTVYIALNINIRNEIRQIKSKNV